MLNLKYRLRFNLFWKILLSLWAVFFLVITINIVIVVSTSDDIKYRPVPPHYMQQLKFRKKKLEYILNERRRNLHRNNKILQNTFLLDKNGEDYLNRDVPELLSLLHHQVSYRQYNLLAFKKENHYVGGVEVKINKKKYKLYIHQKTPLFSQRYFGMLVREFTRKAMFIIFLASFPFSLLIAWIFNRPIKRLRASSQDLIRNLEDRKHLNELAMRSDEFGDLAKDLEKLAEHLSLVIKSKNRLLSDVSHELRSPLARQKIAIALAEKSESKDIESIDRIKLEGDRLESMVTSLLDYAKLDDLSSIKSSSTFNLSQCLNELVNDSKFESETKNILIQSDIKNAISISGVQSFLLSGIENLIRNAIRYANKTVNVILKIKNDSIFIIVEDDGCGVAENELDKIFDAFYRPQLDRSRDSGGVGLGLSIASKAVSFHQGIIWAESVDPHGLRLVIELPYTHLP